MISPISPGSTSRPFTILLKGTGFFSITVFSGSSVYTLICLMSEEYEFGIISDYKTIYFPRLFSSLSSADHEYVGRALTFLAFTSKAFNT